MKRSSIFLIFWVLLGIPFLVFKNPLERLGPVLFAIVGVALIASAITYTVLRIREWKKARQPEAGGGNQVETDDV